MDMNCSIDTCEKDAWARNLCPMHLRRLRVHGNPNYTTRTPNGKKLEWLESTLAIQTEDCIEWPFGVGNHGYGYLNYESQQMLAHQVVLLLAGKQLPTKTQETRHICDNKKCVNLNHLSVGTHKQNAQDRKKAGTTLPGSKRSNSKLTEDDVKEIRSTENYRGVCADLAKKYNVSNQLISSIRKPDTHRWNHI